MNHEYTFGKRRKLMQEDKFPHQISTLKLRVQQLQPCGLRKESYGINLRGKKQDHIIESLVYDKDNTLGWRGKNGPSNQ